MNTKRHYPNSRGDARPVNPAPVNACDAHFHIYDKQFLVESLEGMVENATVADYRKLQNRIGTTRAVVVQPRAHGIDNSVTLSAIHALGARYTRGIAVVHPSVTEEELEALHEGGIRGIRFTLYTPTNAVVSFDMVESLSHRIHALGWHVQLHWTAEQVVQYTDLLKRLPCGLVFDHMGRLPVIEGRSHSAYRVIRDLIDSGNTWVKLSGAYLDSKSEGYQDMDDIASGWAMDAPERVVWGSDWPHSTEKNSKPDDAALFDLLARWVPNSAARERVLVDNPAQLYQFN